MTVDDFLLCDPCIEEIDGFMHGLTVQKLMTDDARDRLTERLTELKSGRRTPCNTILPRTWHYASGKPARRFSAVEIAILEKKLSDTASARLALKREERRKGVRTPAGRASSSTAR